MSGAVYLDSSALVKLVVEERESGDLRRYLAGDSQLWSSLLARIETVRAVRAYGAQYVADMRALLEEMTLIDVDTDLLDSAAELGDEQLRSLDAIHLASVLVLGEELEALVTYDRRMTVAARGLGLPVAHPGW
jgi:uncharacterized protein